MKRPDRRDIFAIVRIACCVALLIFFVFIDIDDLGGKSICFYYNATGRFCPGCGGTRALCSLMHLRIEDAFAYNPVVTTLIFPAFVLIVINDLLCLIRRLFFKKNSISFIEYIVFGGFLGSSGGEAEG